jgi:hypothetical protein
MFFDTGPSGSDYFPPTAGAGFDLEAYFRDPVRASQDRLVFDVDPGIVAPYDPTPTWVPGTEVVAPASTPPAPLDEAATFVGAFAPDLEPWTQGWTTTVTN